MRSGRNELRRLHVPEQAAARQRKHARRRESHRRSVVAREREVGSDGGGGGRLERFGHFGGLRPVKGSADGTNGGKVLRRDAGRVPAKRRRFANGIKRREGIAVSSRRRR